MAYGARIERLSDGTAVKVNCEVCHGVYIHALGCAKVLSIIDALPVESGDIKIVTQDPDEFFKELDAETERRIDQARTRIIKGFARG